MSVKTYELIIIGAGPAGLTAAVYASRYKVQTLVVGKLPGGLISEAHEVCNFPTYDRIKGIELAQKLIKQVQDMNVQIVQDDIIKINKKKDLFEIKTNFATYSAKKIILAIGTERRKLEVAEESKYIGKGLSYCATCDATFYKNKTVAIVGGSDAALTAGLLLAEYAKKVYIIYRRDKFFRAEPAWVEQVKKNKKIEAIFKSNIKKIHGAEKVEGVLLDTGKSLKLDGIFVEIGNIPDENLTDQLGLKKEKGYVVIDKNQKTNINGVYAAGDITNNPLKQAVTACGEGAIAAYSAYQDLRKN